MANFVLRLPATSFRSFSISASSNGAVPGTSSSTQNGGPVILELPLDKIRRPLMRTRANDQNKVKELMDSIKEIGLQVPIDVLEVDGVYYGFSGCHRYEAHHNSLQNSTRNKRNTEAPPPLSPGMQSFPSD